MSQLHWTHFEKKHREQYARPISTSNLPKGWIKTRPQRQMPHAIPSDSGVKLNQRYSATSRWRVQSHPKKSEPSDQCDLVVYLDRAEPDESSNSILRESVALELSTSATTSSSITSSILDRIKSTLHIESTEKPIYFGPEDNRGWLQRYAQRRNAKRREVQSYRDNKYQVYMNGRYWTAWTSEEHGWVAVPTLAHPSWKQKLPFMKKMPDIYSSDRFDAFDARFQRVDTLLDDLAVSATMRSQRNTKAKEVKKEKVHDKSLFERVREEAKYAKEAKRQAELRAKKDHSYTMKRGFSL